MEEEVACIDLSPATDENGISEYLGVGLWTDISVRVLALPSLENVFTERLMGGKNDGNYYLINDFRL